MFQPFRNQKRQYFSYSVTSSPKDALTSRSLISLRLTRLRSDLIGFKIALIKSETFGSCCLT